MDRVAFRRLLTYQRPATKDSEIPHRTSIAKAVHEKAYKVKEILKGLFAVRTTIFLFFSHSNLLVYTRVFLVKSL